MPAAIQFDFSRAVARATHLFWKNGYRNTSVRDLMKVMTIGEGSFYNTFRSKRYLYLECLKHYNLTVNQRRLNALLEQKSVKEGVRAFFRTLLDDLDNPRTPALCMLAGSVSADVLADRELSRVVLDDMAAFSRSFSERLAVAKLAGELQADFNEKTATRVLVTFLMGLFRTIRVLYSRSEMEEEVEMLLRGLNL